MKKKIIILVLFFIIFLSIIFEANYLNENKVYKITNENTKFSSNTIENIITSSENNFNEFISYNVLPDTLKNFKYQIKNNDNTDYSNNINFNGTENYNKIEGISTFRGNNYRDTASYGTVSVIEKSLEKKWTNIIGQTDNWTGVGWNGQPAIIKWDDTVKKQMNIYDEFKQKEDFVEIIYGCLDSYVHFYDLETGHPSRDSIKLDSSIKGSVTIDPRGYPLLYVGQGINEVSGESVRFGYHIYSLINGEELYFINGRDNFAYIGWGAFDGNPVINAETDTMILPGENGLIYIVKLNTNYDKINGKISISPNIIKYRYTKNNRAGGTENSMTMYKNYAFFINNNGVIQCLDINNLIPIWSYDMEDDCDATLRTRRRK